MLRIGLDRALLSMAATPMTYLAGFAAFGARYTVLPPLTRTLVIAGVDGDLGGQGGPKLSAALAEVSHLALHPTVKSTDEPAGRRQRAAAEWRAGRGAAGAAELQPDRGVGVHAPDARRPAVPAAAGDAAADGADGLVSAIWHAAEPP